jgi:hypothetical protein
MLIRINNIDIVKYKLMVFILPVLYDVLNAVPLQYPTLLLTNAMYELSWPNITRIVCPYHSKSKRKDVGIVSTNATEVERPLHVPEALPDSCI